MKDRLDIILKRYNEITELLSDPSIVQDIPKMTALSKEQSALEERVDVYRKYLHLEDTIQDLRVLADDDDDDMALLAQAELEDREEEFETVEENLKVLLLPKDENDDKDVIVEIRGAAGGDEGNIFAGDLYRMYAKYAELKGWKIELLNAVESTAGGYSQIEFMMTGDHLYSFMKYESGTHRVQRVPATESQGRIHTSTSTVLVMPEAEEIDIEINAGDIRFDAFCSSGPGGQSVNTTKSAVRLTHEPTGISVTCQEGKSQHENKAKAMILLKTRIYDKIRGEQEEAEDETRRALIGRGNRSEKIRTYNYPQNRVTDHRIGFTIQRLDAIMDGRLDLVIEALVNEDQKRRLSGNNA